jgi:hypothetical protein
MHQKQPPPKVATAVSPEPEDVLSGAGTAGCPEDPRPEKTTRRAVRRAAPRVKKAIFFIAPPLKFCSYTR